MADGVIPTQEAFGRIADTVRRVEADPRYPGKPIPQRKRISNVSTCQRQNAKIQLTVFGSPTGGTFDLPSWNVNGTTATPTFNWDDTAAEVKTEMVATFANITTAELTTTGGPFPDATIELEFTGDLANTNIAIPLADWGSLTGGTGVAIISSLTQLGIA